MMSEPFVQKLGQKKDWPLNAAAFHRLLDWLDDGAASDGQKYLEMRRRLVAYFDRKNCLAPDELADETLNRVTRRLEEEGVIVSEAPAQYCYIVARLVFMEQTRAAQKAKGLSDDLRRQQWPPRGAAAAAPEARDEPARREELLLCLEGCVGKLGPPNRKLILSYYVGAERAKIENRRTLAAELGISVNALSIRACRIRGKLEDCVKRCAGAP